MPHIRSTTRSVPSRAIGTTALGLAVFLLAPAAHAQAPDNVALADAAFKEAQALRAQGNDAAACPKFAESKRLAPAVGVTLYLGDCYAKTGRSASAWKEFHEAETLARKHGDKRADIAAQRAAALAPGLSRLTVEVPADAAKSGEQLQLDGAALASDSWNVPVTVDPGDHVVVVTTPGQPSRTLDAHVDAGGATVTLATALAIAPTGPAAAAAAATTAAVPPSPAPATEPTSAPAAAVAPTPEAIAPSSGRGAGARWVAGGLMAAGAIGVGIGTWLVTYKTQDMMPDGTYCHPHLQPHAIPEAAVAFSAGGVALLAGAGLFIMHWPGRTEVSLAPTVGPGGGGTVLRGRF